MRKRDIISCRSKKSNAMTVARKKGIEKPANQETIEEFLARGGKIDKIRNGRSSAVQWDAKKILTIAHAPNGIEDLKQ